MKLPKKLNRFYLNAETPRKYLGDTKVWFGTILGLGVFKIGYLLKLKQAVKSITHIVEKNNIILLYVFQLLLWNTLNASK